MPQSLLDTLNRFAAQASHESASAILERSRRRPPKLVGLSGRSETQPWWNER